MTSKIEPSVRDEAIKSLVGCQVVRQYILIIQVTLVSASNLDPRATLVEVRFCDSALKTIVDGESMDI